MALPTVLHRVGAQAQPAVAEVRATQAREEEPRFVAVAPEQRQFALTRQTLEPPALLAVWAAGLLLQVRVRRLIPVLLRSRQNNHPISRNWNIARTGRRPGRKFLRRGTQASLRLLLRVQAVVQGVALAGKAVWEPRFASQGHFVPAP